MTREEFLSKAAGICIGKSEVSELFFVEPLWETYVKTELGDYPEDLTHEETLEILELTVKKLNAMSDRSHVLINWLYDVLTAKVEPAMVEEENELMKNIVEYMKLNRNLEEREKALNEQEKIVSEKKNISKLIAGMRFSKK
jgi:hypothetical protein